MSSKLLNVVLVLFLLLSPFAGHIVMMAAMSAMVIGKVATAQSVEQKIHQLPTLTGTLVLGLIMAEMLGIILLYHAR